MCWNVLEAAVPLLLTWTRTEELLLWIAFPCQIQQTVTWCFVDLTGTFPRSCDFSKIVFPQPFLKKHPVMSILFNFIIRYIYLYIYMIYYCLVALVLVMFCVLCLSAVSVSLSSHLQTIFCTAHDLFHDKGSCGLVESATIDLMYEKSNVLVSRPPIIHSEMFNICWRDVFGPGGGPRSLKYLRFEKTCFLKT